MRKTQRLLLRDLRDIYRLLGHCRDLGRDCQAWRTHLLRQLSRLLNAQVGVAVQVVPGATGALEPVGAISVGWRSDHGAENWQQFVDEEQPCADPLFEAVLERLQHNARLVTRTRPQLLGDQQWLNSVFYNQYPRLAGLRECLYSYCRLTLGGRAVIDGIELHRPVGEPAFTERDRRIVRWLHHELRPLVGRQLTAPCEPSLIDLSPRLKQTLERLLKGDGEKQIADRLGLSRATVHEYVTVLYRRFGVHSRAELLVRWIRYDRANQDGCL